MNKTYLQTYIPRIIGYAISLLAIIVIVGWVAQIRTLIQILPSFVPMQFNTALCFLLAGFALVSLSYEKKTFAFVSALIIFSVSGLTLIEYLSGVDLAIDELFQKHYIVTKTSHPGRMAPSTAVCFITSSIGLLLLTIKNFKYKNMIVFLLSTFTVTLPLITLIEYASGIEQSSELTKYTVMALHTGLGFLTLGIGMLVLSIGVGWSANSTKIPLWIPFNAGICVLIITLFLYFAMANQEMRSIQDRVQSMTNIATEEIKKELQSEILASLRMEDRWEASNGILKDVWINDAENYVNDHDSLIGIFWIDSDYTIQWEATANAVNLEAIKKQIREITNFNFIKDMKIASNTIVDPKAPTPSLLFTFHTLESEDGFDGALIEVHDIKKLIETAVPEKMLKDIHFTIFNLQQEVYPVLNNKFVATKNEQQKAFSELNVMGIIWQVYGVPTSSMINRLYSPIGSLVLLGGATIALVTAIGVFFALKSRVRSSELEVALKDIQQRQKIVEAILNSSADGIFGLDSKGGVTFANPATVEMLGWSLEEQLGKPQHDLICHNQDDCEIFTRKDGSTFQVEYTKTPLRINEQIYGSVVVFRDITKRKQVENDLLQNRNLLRSIINNNDSITMVFDENDNYLMINEQFQNITQLKEKELIGKNIYEQQDHSFYPMIEMCYQKSSKNTNLKPIECEIIINGENHHFLVNCFSIFNKNNELTATCLMAKTITEIKQTEQQLQKNIISLENYTLELERARKDAEQANAAKSNFLSNMSHELRTPLNGVIGVASLMENMDLDQKQSKYVSYITSSAKDLLGLISDIIDLTKIESEHFEFTQQPTNLYRFIQTTYRSVLYKLNEKNLDLLIRFDPQTPNSILTDPIRLKQVIVNLISNAVKFTKKGHITLNVSCIEDNSKTTKVRFEVIDTGIGILEEHQNKLFNKFTQADDSTKKEYGGTGLGLSICKQLVENMGGDIGFDSRLNEGSLFWFELPFTKEVFDEIPCYLIDSCSLTACKSTIHIADTHPQRCQILTEIIALLGYKYVISHSKKELLQNLKIKYADVIIVDEAIAIPEVFEQHTSSVIYLTNELDSSIAGLNGHKHVITLNKPVDIKIIYDTIQEILGSSPLSSKEV